ncbi:MAG: MFS transporter [Sphingomicrobium sp.]
MNGEPTAIAGRPGEPAYPPVRIAWWAVAVFFLLYMLSFIDRSLLNLLVGPIRASLGISDFQISLLQGLSFALFYTAFGIPLGRLVDRGPRRRIICLGILLWSLATAGCGLAGRYWQLLLGRIGVAVGEATLAPAAYSLLSDLFPPHRLALPMSIMGTGAAVGSAAAAIIGGIVIGAVPASGMVVPLLGHLAGWQLAFIVAGLPGLLLAPVIFTVAEPARRAVESFGRPHEPSRAIRHILADRALYGGHFIGFGLYSLINYGITTWLPTFFIREHGWSPTSAAVATGWLALFGVVPGGVMMGFAVDRWFASGRRNAHLLFFAGAAIVQMLFVIAAMAATSAAWCIALLVPQQMLAGFTGVAAAALQITTPERMRGEVSAIYLLVFNLIGLGLGPSVVAGFTDFVFADDMKVGASIALTFIVFAPLCAVLMLVAARRMPQAVLRQTAGAGDNG